MKKAMLFASILALALSAKAANVNFAALPATATPTVLPNGYGNLDWSNFSYVDPSWSGAGEGFRQGPISLDVAYLGGGECEKAGASCSASIYANAATTSLQNFVAQSAIVTAGYHAETIKVSAYNHGNFVGSQQYDLTTSLQQINFPANWGTITQLVIDANAGTVVLYALQMQPMYARSLDDKQSAGTNNPVYNPGPRALGVNDPPVEDGLVIEPPVAPPTAPQHGKSIGLYSGTDNGGVLGLPLLSPTAPKHGKPAGRYSGNDNADGGVVGPPTVKPSAQ